MQPHDVRFIGVDIVPRTPIVLIPVDNPQPLPPEGIYFREGVRTLDIIGDRDATVANIPSLPMVIPGPYSLEIMTLE
jgi:hypothetical protein